MCLQYRIAEIVAMRFLFTWELMLEDYEAFVSFQLFLLYWFWYFLQLLIDQHIPFGLCFFDCFSEAFDEFKVLSVNLLIHE